MKVEVKVKVKVNVEVKVKVHVNVEVKVTNMLRGLGSCGYRELGSYGVGR